MQKKYKIVNWFRLNLRPGLLSILYYVIGYGILLGLSFLCSTFFPQFSHVTKWVLVGFWGLINLLILVAYILTRVFRDNEDMIIFADDIKAKMHPSALVGLTYKQAKKLGIGLFIKSSLLYAFNSFVSNLICYIVIFAGYVFMRYSILNFEWAVLLETAFNFEIYTLIGLYLLYSVLLSFPGGLGMTEFENATKTYFWRKCKKCGGLEIYQILSVDYETKHETQKIRDSYIAHDQLVETYKIDGVSVGVYRDKKVDAKYETMTHTTYFINTKATCQKCGNTFNSTLTQSKEIFDQYLLYDIHGKRVQPKEKTNTTK